MSATKVAPPRCFATLNMTRFHVSLRASGASVAIYHVALPTRLIAARLKPLAMTIGSLTMIPISRHCERKRSNQRFEATHGRLPRIRTNARNDARGRFLRGAILATFVCPILQHQYPIYMQDFVWQSKHQNLFFVHSKESLKNEILHVLNTTNSNIPDCHPPCKHTPIAALPQNISPIRLI